MTRHPNRPAAGALVASMCLALCWAVLAFAAESTRQYEVDIQKQPLGEALQEFSQQTQLQFGYLPTSEEEEQLLVGPVKGLFTAAEVLAKLLPAGFTFAWINPRTISIVSPPENVPPGGVKETAVAKDRQQSERSEDEVRSMANGGGKSGSARGPYAFDWGMTVEASKIFESLDLDIPTVVLDRGDIESLGASTVTDLLRYVTQQTHTMADAYLGDGTQFADLRGLGFDTTLVLINGRRTIATASSLTVNAFDLNSIPLGVVERIEMVADSTSVMHGADAIGGVLNIVLREDIPEPTLNIDYAAANGGGVERHVAFGASAVGSRVRGSIVLDYFDRSPLLGQERDRWSNQDFRRFGGTDWRASAASPGNVRSATLDNLPGLPSTSAAIPAVAAGIELNPADFLSGAGQQNVASLFRYSSILSDGTKKAVAAQGEYRLSANVSAFGDLLYVNWQTFSQSAPAFLLNALMPAVNPHNPFGTDVLVDLLLTDLGPGKSSRRGDMLRGVGGARGRVGTWAWEASLNRTQNDDATVQGNRLDPSRIATALSQADPDDALNPFGSNSVELLTSLRARPKRNRFGTDMTQATAYARGPLFDLPHGHADLTIGGERRNEGAEYDVEIGPPVSGSHERFVTAAFAELRLPIVDPAAQVRAVHDLYLVASGRFDSYSDVGDSFNAEYALIWQPTSALTLRASSSTSFRPPPLFDLYLPKIDTPFATSDSARNNELAFPILRAGGNADLKPSTANSFTASLRFAPADSSGLHVGASYWSIDVSETIGIPAAERLLVAEGTFPQRIVRGQPSLADVAAGVPGPLQLIDVTRLNYGSVRTSGVDFSASRDVDTFLGRFTPQVSATWVHDFTTSDLVVGTDVSRVGVADLQGSVPRWRAVAGLHWSRQGVGVSASARYVPSYDDVDVPGHRTGRSIAAQTLIDIQLAFDLSDMVGAESIWRGFEFRAGALNLLNEEPPFAEAGLFFGYDPSQGELRQRFAYLKVAKKF
jgi:iron complex outermembrane receptor protein